MRLAWPVCYCNSISESRQGASSCYCRTVEDSTWTITSELCTDRPARTAPDGLMALFRSDGAHRLFSTPCECLQGSGSVHGAFAGTIEWNRPTDVHMYPPWATNLNCSQTRPENTTEQLAKQYCIPGAKHSSTHITSKQTKYSQFRYFANIFGMFRTAVGKTLHCTLTKSQSSSPLLGCGSRTYLPLD